MSANIELSLCDHAGDTLALIARGDDGEMVDVRINKGRVVQLDADAVTTLVRFLQGDHKLLLP